MRGAEVGVGCAGAAVVVWRIKKLLRGTFSSQSMPTRNVRRTPPQRYEAARGVNATANRSARMLFATVALQFVRRDRLHHGALAQPTPQQIWLVQTMRAGRCPRFPTPSGRNASSLAKTKCFAQAPAKGAAGCPAGSCVLRCCLMPVPRPRAPFLPPSPSGVRTRYLSHLSRLPYPLRHRPKTDDRRHCTCNTYLLTYR